MRDPTGERVNPATQRVLIIGMRGAGKTTVGRLAAMRLKCNFCDLDEAVLADLGATSVCDVFERLGEQAWRAGEARALESLVGTPRESSVIVAVGAGAPEHGQSLDALTRARAIGWLVVWLDASLESLVARIGAALGDRSALTSLAPEDELKTLKSRRDPIYASLADSVVDGSSGSPTSVADALSRAVDA